MNFVQNIVDIAARQPDHPALIEGDRTLTYREMINAVVAMAAQLGSLGVAKGDVVGLLLRDNIDHILAVFAAGWLGAGSASLDWRAKPNESRRALGQLGVRCVLLERPDPAFSKWNGVSLDALANTPVTRPAPAEPVPAPNAPYLVLMTSGTTGNPHGVEVSHEDFMHRTQRGSPTHAVDASDRYLSVSPLCFSGGKNWLHVALFTGATAVLHPTLFSAQDYVDAVRRHAITWGSLVPATARSLLDFSRAMDDGGRRASMLFPDFKLLSVGADALSAGEKLEIRERLTPNLYTNYSTSATGKISILMPSQMESHGASVGRPLNKVTVEIVDRDGRPLAVDCDGLIRCRAPGIRPEAANAKNHKSDGWYYTDDTGRLDRDGFLYISGRISDIIIRGGTNIVPAEIESTIADMDGVTDVAVVGKPSPNLGESVTAFVVGNADLTADAVKRHCRSILSPHKVPEEVHIVGTLPRTTSGKVIKRSLTERFQQ